VHVAYKGAAPAVIDLVAGRVDAMLVSAPSVLSQIKARRLKALAVTSLKRSAALPELPTLNEAGLPGYESVAWWGMLAPAATPKAIVTKLNSAVVKSLNADETKERLAREGAEVAGTSPAEFGEFLRRETQKWARVVKASGIKVE
jgi:tripartite-type tricarboxylate transporter receptor subunit TctC